MGKRSSTSPIFQHYASAQIWAQLVFDVAIALGCLFVFTVQRTGQFSMPYQVLALVMALLVVVVYQWLGVYLHLRTGGLLNEARTLAKAWLSVLFLLAVIGFVTKTNTIFSREALLKTATVGYVGQLAFHMGLRFLLRAVRAHGYNLRRAMLIGGGPQTLDFAARLARNPWIGIDMLGYVDAQAPDTGDVGEDGQQPGLPYLGTAADITEIVRTRRVELAFITMPMDRSHEIADVVQRMAPLNVDIHWVPDFSAFDLINHSVREVEGQPVLCLTDSPMTGLGRVGKWIEDKALALIILMLSSPVLLTVALAIKLTSHGPVFFRQARAGINGEVIEVLKFRTMHTHQEPKGTLTQAYPGDPRITPLGAFLRRTSLDEFPQFFNVLGGSMSIVGPRPHALEHHGVYEQQVDAYMLRHRIKPGITGWAQVNGWRGHIDRAHKIEMRVKYDLQYINNWSLTFDLVIIAMTAWAVVIGKNAY